MRAQSSLRPHTVVDLYHWKIPNLHYVCVCVCVCVCMCVHIYPPHPLASTTPHHPTHPLPQYEATPLYAAAENGHTDAVKELISAGCDINLADEVKQMTGLALALACLAFRGRVA
jgi:hypothetical protein